LNPIVNDYLNSGVPVPQSYKQIRKEGGILASNQPQRSRSENQGASAAQKQQQQNQ
jgi:hypothetical protein